MRTKAEKIALFPKNNEEAILAMDEKELERRATIYEKLAKDKNESKEQRDIAVTDYYNSLDKLREFYSSKLEVEKDKKYEVKLHDLDAVIWENKAKEAERRGREESAQNARAKAVLAKAAADKLRQENKRAAKIAIAETNDQKYIGQKAIEHDIFLKSLEGLEPKQKKAKFLAHFLEHSAKMYIHDFNSANENKAQRPIAGQFEILLVSGEDKDLKEVAEKIKSSLPAYIAQMDKDLGRRLQSHGLGDHDRANILNDSLYAVTAQKINKVVDHSIGKSEAERQYIQQENEAIIKHAVGYLTKFSFSKSISKVYNSVMNRYDKSQAIDTIKKLGITDAKSILHHQYTPPIKPKGQYKSVSTR